MRMRAQNYDVNDEPSTYKNAIDIIFRKIVFRRNKIKFSEKMFLTKFRGLTTIKAITKD